ncbi:MAG: hypothetical protein QG597_4421 [Actinomycetota bacterium]|nr:hypothetical protein [Actinomycetota bacterium]
MLITGRTVPLLATAVSAMAILSACASDNPAAGNQATSGFDVASNGFSFANYGDDVAVTNLDPAAMRAMFGDQVCARVAGDTCTLQPTAAEWMKQQNDDMAGGHCFGLAGLSWAMFDGAITPQRYGAATASELKLEGNRALQTDIAAVFVTQSTSPTTEAKLALPPSQAIAALEQAWRKGEGYALAIFNLKDGEPVDGHAVTPTAVKPLDDGRTGIVLYDNNFPGEPQVMVVDLQAETWTYTTSADPGEDPQQYTGGTDNPFELWPVAPMLGPQNCPFCEGGQGSEATGVAGETRSVSGGSDFTTVNVNQRANAAGVTFTVTDDAGQPIPGVQPVSPLSGPEGAPSAARVPKDVPFVVRIDGSRLTQAADTDLTIIGPGYSYGIDTFTVGVGEVETVRFDPSTNRVSYTTTGESAPDIGLTLDGDVSYGLIFGGLALPGGGTVTVTLDESTRTVSATAGAVGQPAVDFDIERIDSAGEDAFASEPIELAPDEALVVEYGAWVPGGPVPAGIATAGSTTITERLEVVAQTSATP